MTNTTVRCLTLSVLAAGQMGHQLDVRNRAKNLTKDQNMLPSIELTSSLIGKLQAIGVSFSFRNVAMTPNMQLTNDDFGVETIFNLLALI